MQAYREFKYLYVVQNENRRSDDVLECIYDSQEKIKGKFVMHDEVKRNYYVFEDIDAALRHVSSLPDKKRTFHEVIFGWKPQKIKLDIDIKEVDLDKIMIKAVVDRKQYVPPVMFDDDFLGKLVSGELNNNEDNIMQKTPEDVLAIFTGGAEEYKNLETNDEKIAHICKCIDDAIIQTFYIMYFKTIDVGDILTCTSSGRDSPTSPMKYSFHKTIEGYSIDNNIEGRTFTNVLQDMLDPRFRQFVDSINKQTQNFRMVGCHKQGSTRVKRVVSGHADRLAIVQNVDGCVRLPSNSDYQDVADRIGCIDLASNIGEEDAKKIIELAAGYTEGNKFRSRKGNIFSYDRLRPTHCLICDEVHHKDNTTFLTCNEDCGIIKIYINCRHLKGSQKYIGEVVTVAIENEVNIDKKEFSTELAKAKTSEASLKKAVKSVAGKSVILLTSFETLPEPQKHIYCDPALRPFELKDTLCVKAKMKMGKTKNLRQFIDKHFDNNGLREPVIRILSFRQTFGGNIKEKFPDFTLYSDVKGPLTQNRLIVQIESLHRVEITPDIDPPDLLVMDECESIFEQFESGLHKSFGLAWGVFQWMIRTSRYLIAMDANLSDRTYRILQRMRVDYYNLKYPANALRSLYYHHDKYQNQVDDRYYFTTDKNKWYYCAQQAIADGYRITVPISSLREAEIFRKDVETKHPEAHIGFYSSKTSMSQKREHFNNVAEYWSQYDVLIYTPTVSAGVSYEEKHYDKIFAYFTDKACNVETCLQMLGRIRNVGQREYCICLSASKNNLPTDIDDIEACVNNRRLNLFRQFDSSLLQIEFDDTGEVKCHRSDYFYLWLENTRVRNLSLNDFNGRFVKYIAEGGATCDMVDVDVPDETLANIAKRRRAIRAELNDEEIKCVAASPDLTTDDARNIEDKFIKQEDITDAEFYAYEKYKLRRHYKFDGVINEAFIKKYNNRKAKRIYRNLGRILAKTDIDTALENIKNEERGNYSHIMEMDERHQFNDLSRAYVYDHHRTAIGLMRLCGFNNLSEQRVIPETYLFDNFRSNERGIADNIMHIRGDFDLRNFQYKDVKYFTSMSDLLYITKVLKYVNKILLSMYDIRIGIDKVDKTMYRLKYSGVFPLKAADDRPYIEVGRDEDGPDGPAFQLE